LTAAAVDTIWRARPTAACGRSEAAQEWEIPRISGLLRWEAGQLFSSGGNVGGMPVVRRNRALHHMNGREFSELNSFVAVARHRSFRKAAAELGVSLPAVSQNVKSLEEKLGVRLLNRTTRAVAPTEAGEQLLVRLVPALEDVESAIQVVDSFRGKPKGTLRLSVGRMAATNLIGPLIAGFMEEYPEINLELEVDDSRKDIVGGRFDAGVRLGQLVEQDMIALRLSDEFRMVAVASPTYINQRGRPQTPGDLAGHACIRVRAPWDGSLLDWQFEKDGERMAVKVDGGLTVNDVTLLLRAALDGVGVAYMPESVAGPFVAGQQLEILLGGWAATFAGHFLYYSSRRQMPMPLKAFIDYVQKTPRRPTLMERVTAPANLPLVWPRKAEEGA
jgi:DNA-binding transcriptional LysR family regulator